MPSLSFNSLFLLTLPAFLALYLSYSLQPLSISDYAKEHLQLAIQFPFYKTLEVTDNSVPRTFTRRIVAVGDLHGDLPNARKVLQMTRVVDDNGDWSGEIDYFVQTGDIIDRGDDTIALFSWMEQLRTQAQSTGGVVLSHLGNHEWMNVIGDWRYVYHSEIDTFGSVSARQAMISTGSIGQSWLKNYSTASRVPLHPSLGPINTDYPPPPSSQSSRSPLSHAALSFVHGGLASNSPSLLPYPSRINTVAHSLLRKLFARNPQPPPHPPNPYPGLPEHATAEEQTLYGTDGPLWYRGWALEQDSEGFCAKVDEVMGKIGVRRLIMGHTPNFQNIVSRCGGKIIIIDTGISHAYGGALSALSIQYTLTPTAASTNPGKQTWTEKEIVTAVYQDREDVVAVDVREVVGDFLEW